MASLRGLSLRDLEYTQTIANEGHFGRAASLCGVSQPAISSQIQKLEARIGFPIFERQGKSISVTENGRIFLAKAETILNEARELLELSSSLTSPMEGELRLGVIPTLGPTFCRWCSNPSKTPTQNCTSHSLKNQQVFWNRCLQIESWTSWCWQQNQIQPTAEWSSCFSNPISSPAPQQKVLSKACRFHGQKSKTPSSSCSRKSTACAARQSHFVT